MPCPLRVGGVCDVPTSAKAVSANVTVAGPTAAGSLTLSAGGTPVPPVPTVEYQRDQALANNAVVSLGAAADILVTCNQSTGTAHLILDVNDYLK
jgi:hypothetical protein